MTKLCVNCKHSKEIPGRADMNRYRTICTHPNNASKTANLITGEFEKNWGVCELQRMWGVLDAMFLGKCGKRGRWFEPKEKK